MSEYKDCVWCGKQIPTDCAHTCYAQRAVRAVLELLVPHTTLRRSVEMTMWDLENRLEEMAAEGQTK